MAVATTSSNAALRGGSTLTKRQARLAMIMLAPTFFVLILVAFYPLVRTFSSSFTNEPFANPNAEVVNVGLENYQKLLGIQIAPFPEGASLRDTMITGYRRVSTFELFGERYLFAAGDPMWIQAVINTVLFTIISVALEFGIGLVVALVVNTRFRGRGIMRAVMLIPWAIPTAISTVLWRYMLNDNTTGALNALFNAFGLIEPSASIAWRSQYPLLSVILVDVWKTVPFVALLLLAGLQTIPTDLYEAGAVDGATVPQRFFRITLPLLFPTVLIALVFRTLDALRVFDVFAILLPNTTRSMATHNYEMMVTSYQYGYASATGVLIFIIIFAFTILYMSLFRVEVD